MLSSKAVDLGEYDVSSLPRRMKDNLHQLCGFHWIMYDFFFGSSEKEHAKLDKMRKESGEKLGTKDIKQLRKNNEKSTERSGRKNENEISKELESNKKEK